MSIDFEIIGDITDIKTIAVGSSIYKNRTLAEGLRRQPLKKAKDWRWFVSLTIQFVMPRYIGMIPTGVQ